MSSTQSADSSSLHTRTKIIVILVAALGYFVDIFDLLLFAIVRVDSLKSLGVSADQLKPTGLWLDNYLQVSGLVIGGIVWGILGDRRGRISVLFGSILVYSVANILNAFIADVPNSGGGAILHALGLGSAIHQYGVLRFIAGFGLAGELGAGITLVSELVSKERRGLATTFIATIGILGAVVAYFITRVVEWRTAFLIGGIMGIALLVLRVGVVESGMFLKVQSQHARSRGAIWLLLYPWNRARRYLCVILCAVPIWFCVGILIKYCDSIGASMGMPEGARPSPGPAIMWCYIGLAIGDMSSGLLSQWMRSRRSALWVFHLLTILSIALYFTVGSSSVTAFYVCATLIGFASGYWAVFVTMAAEQFGTNLRATAATTAPNMVRWSAAAGTFMWTQSEFLLGNGPNAPWQAAVVVAAIFLPIAIASVYFLPETYGRDLNFTEE
ncbi:MAG: MFS transporter [Planctomycetota bacterium]|nr:MFS transporter [Planctomycetota bacterium]